MTDLTSLQIDELLTDAHEMVNRAAKEILPYFRQEIKVTHKDGKGIYDPVTDADRNSEQVIRAYLAEKWPDHSIIGEEFANEVKASKFCWIIDPIDGTRAFVMGSPLWGTLIGLSHNEKPIIGMMNQPFTEERFWASPKGAFGHWDGTERKLNVRDCKKLDQAIITTTCPDLFANANDRESFNQLRNHCRMTRYGGDCYSYCLLAMGHIDLIVESGLASYDIAPLIPLIERAGGVITNWQGESAANGGQIIAAGSAELHEAALKHLSI